MLIQRGRENLSKLLKELFRIKIKTKNSGGRYSLLTSLSTKCLEIKLIRKWKSLRLSNLHLKKSKLPQYVLFYVGSQRCQDFSQQIS